MTGLRTDVTATTSCHRRQNMTRNKGTGKGLYTFDKFHTYSTRHHAQPTQTDIHTINRHGHGDALQAEDLPPGRCCVQEACGRCRGQQALGPLVQGPEGGRASWRLGLSAWDLSCEPRTPLWARGSNLGWVASTVTSRSLPWTGEGERRTAPRRTS